MKMLGRVGIVVLVIGGAIGLRFYNKGSDESAIHDNMHEWVANTPGYSDDPAYADALFEKCHEPAFEACYSMGGRRSGARVRDDAAQAVFRHGERGCIGARGEPDQADGPHRCYAERVRDGHALHAPAQAQKQDQHQTDARAQ